MERWFAIFTKMERRKGANLCPLLRRDHVGELMFEVDDFSTTDETDESILEALDWWLMALTPQIPFMGYFLDDNQEERLERLYRSAGVMGVTGTALYLAGAGSSMSNPATITASMAMQVEKYRMLSSGAARIGATVARGAVRTFPLLAAYYAVRSYGAHLASLDWMPDIYQV
jgi:hypothetical protein